MIKWDSILYMYIYIYNIYNIYMYISTYPLFFLLFPPVIQETVFTSPRCRAWLGGWPRHSSLDLRLLASFAGDFGWEKCWWWLCLANIFSWWWWFSCQLDFFRNVWNGGYLTMRNGWDIINDLIMDIYI
jgi:hypothetical protein